MDIVLTPEMEQFVKQTVATGKYPSASAVIHEGLRLLRALGEPGQERLDELRREIALGIEQAEQGKTAATSAREVLAAVREARQQKAQAEG